MSVWGGHPRASFNCPLGPPGSGNQYTRAGDRSQVSRPAGMYCPFSPAEIKKCRTLLKWPQWKLASEIRAITGGKTKPVNVARWERGKGRPGLAVSLALVGLFRPVWYGDTTVLEIEAWWASNAVLRKTASKLKWGKRKRGKNNSGQKWTEPLTPSRISVHSDVPQWRPGATKSNSERKSDNKQARIVGSFCEDH